jgi:hypothetical protein
MPAVRSRIKWLFLKNNRINNMLANPMKMKSGSDIAPLKISTRTGMQNNKKLPRIDSHRDRVNVYKVIPTNRIVSPNRMISIQRAVVSISAPNNPKKPRTSE